MSSRHDKSRQFEAGLPEFATPERGSPLSGPDAEIMRELQHRSEAVLRLATETHAAVARSDAAGAEFARRSLATQLTLTTGLIDELLFGESGESVLH
ncbi:hypothetical protein GXB81_05030 [Paraburkholderia sp. Ac-20336]|uniref:hypothetical protein n=1 Tax=Burkholderiaceae TaxID=119060 RepID=UPI00141FD938|nr:MULTISPECIES: hypothetical protein [Burkholderiaceae]MBN3802422.1 hypothetical protein [Paraburkholderia sp. Ac-20336]MBN3847446.1 hypothetical protein [Paraburkholderia sp. Ac-20342]NIF53959.1 hypothetical protein [Burkholderia sp. Ax-1724]NIF77464.1 hypothetical protein [Paraburkholderia sp. Cy-641]